MRALQSTLSRYRETGAVTGHVLLWACASRSFAICRALRGSLLLVAMLSTLPSCKSIPMKQTPIEDPRFEWFEYEGRDAVFATELDSDAYRNPIVAGFYPDPSIVRVQDHFFMVHSSFSYFPGIPIFHSRDLVNWEQIGHVLDRPEQLNLDGLEISEGIFAPAIRYHEGTFYLVTTLVGAGGNFVVTATNAAGPWSEPVWLPSIDGIDPSVFFDDDGRAYITNNGPPIGPPKYDGHRALWIQEFDWERLEMIGPRTMIVDGGVDITREPIWIEAPHIFKVEDTYYLIAAEGGTGTGHSEVVFRSHALVGPWTPYEGNPILTQRHLDPDRPDPVTSTGHADFVKLADGSWWAVFLGTRPYEGDLYNTGRETFMLPVRWDGGWPVILSGDETVPYVHPRPSLPVQPPAPIPTSGNFVVREEFDSAEPAPYWTYMRTVRETWHDLAAGTGSLTIRARPYALRDRAQPSFIGRRQQHATFTASTEMRYAPAAHGARAGMVAFQNDDYYYFFGLARDETGLFVSLMRRAGNGPEESIARTPINTAPGAPLQLRIDGEGSRYSFSYRIGTGWTPLATDVDGAILSTHHAGGFVGVVLGMYAYRP